MLTHGAGESRSANWGGGGEGEVSGEHVDL